MVKKTFSKEPDSASREKKAAEIWETHLAARSPEEMLRHIDEAEADILAVRTTILQPSTVYRPPSTQKF